ncbi:thioredoxin family protein [Thermodesulfobacteriota bacterium]
MKDTQIFNSQRVILAGLCLVPFLFFVMASCGDGNRDRARSGGAKSVIPLIENEKQFAEIVELSGERLLMFDLYADWCAPCKELAPILDEVVRENNGRVSAYRVNVDDNRAIAASLRMTGIPFVVFVKNKAVLHSFLGLYPKKTYVKAIETFSKPT